MLWSCDTVSTSLPSIFFSLHFPGGPGLAITWMSPTQTHCNSPVTSPDPFWAHCAYGKQHRCQEDLVNSPSGGLEETLRTPPHHMAEHRTAGSKIPQSHTAWSNGYDPESVEDVVDVWRYTVLSCMPETMTATTQLPPSTSSIVWHELRLGA